MYTCTVYTLQSRSTGNFRNITDYTAWHAYSKHLYNSNTTWSYFTRANASYFRVIQSSLDWPKCAGRNRFVVVRNTEHKFATVLPFIRLECYMKLLSLLITWSHKIFMLPLIFRIYTIKFITLNVMHSIPMETSTTTSMMANEKFKSKFCINLQMCDNKLE